MTNTSKDKLGRNRLPSERYSQHGGRLSPRFFVWTCKVCSKAWNARSCSARYDAKCRHCETRNSILFSTGKGTHYRTRERVTRFEYYPNELEARFVAKKKNLGWMKRRVNPAVRADGFTTATMHNKIQGSIDIHGHTHPKTKEMTTKNQ